MLCDGCGAWLLPCTSAGVNVGVTEACATPACKREHAWSGRVGALAAGRASRRRMPANLGARFHSAMAAARRHKSARMLEPCPDPHAGQSARDCEMHPCAAWPSRHAAHAPIRCLHLCAVARQTCRSAYPVCVPTRALHCHEGSAYRSLSRVQLPAWRAHRDPSQLLSWVPRWRSCLHSQIGLPCDPSYPGAVVVCRGGLSCCLFLLRVRILPSCRLFGPGGGTASRPRSMLFRSGRNWLARVSELCWAARTYFRFFLCPV